MKKWEYVSYYKNSIVCGGLFKSDKNQPYYGIFAPC